MGEIAAISFAPSQQNFNRERWRWKQRRLEWQCQYPMTELAKPNKQPLMVMNQMAMKPITYASRISTDISLYESPVGSFDNYLEDKPRVFKAIFPDKKRSQQLNEEEWRIEMLPINFLFLTVWPVVDMRLRCKAGGREYPPGVPQDITKVVELDITRWDLKGLDNAFMPSQFSLSVKGTLYPDRRGLRTRLKGHLEMSIGFILPPMLAMIPEDVRKSVAESVLARLVDNMKDKVNGSLLTDYSEFKREHEEVKLEKLSVEASEELVI